MRAILAAILLLTIILGSFFIVDVTPTLSADPVYGVVTYDYTYRFTFTNLGTDLTNVRVRLALPRTLDRIQTLLNATILTPGFQPYQDADENNYIIYTNPRLSAGQNISATIHARVAVYLLDFKVDLAKIGAYNTTDNLYQRYTQPGPKIESNDPTINYTGHILSSGYSNPFEKAHRFYFFVLQWINYQRLLQEEGALFGYENRLGSCNEYTDLFAAFSRSIGIPSARVTSLFDYTHTNFQPGKTFEDKSLSHAYPIFYLPKYGWIPSDPTNGRNRTGSLPTAPEAHWAKADGSIITMTVGQSNQPYWLVSYIPTPGEQPITKPVYEITINSKDTQYSSLTRNLTIGAILALPTILGGVAVVKSVGAYGRRKARMKEVMRLQGKIDLRSIPKPKQPEPDARRESKSGES